VGNFLGLLKRVGSTEQDEEEGEIVGELETGGYCMVI
jgi:hypothetical protein